MIRHGVPTVTLGTSQNEPHAIDEWIQPRRV
jgi:tripeptide aminopeptidase